MYEYNSIEITDDLYLTFFYNAVLDNLPVISCICNANKDETIRNENYKIMYETIENVVKENPGSVKVLKRIYNKPMNEIYEELLKYFVWAISKDQLFLIDDIYTDPRSICFGMGKVIEIIPRG